jgi:hypothetical protein
MAKTRKTRGKKGVLSIPALRRAFEHMDAHAKKLVASIKAKKTTKAAAATGYAKEWKRTMGRSLPAKSAEATISQAMAIGGQRGGMSPVSWSTGAGSPTNVPSLPGEMSATGGSAYGAYPGYVMKGFDNIMWESPAANCSKQDSFPMPVADLGTNAVPPPGSTGLGATTYTAKGGRRSTRRNRKGRRNSRKQMRGAGIGNVFASLIPGMSETSGGNSVMAMAYRPFGGTNPTGVGADMQYQWKGMGPGASPSAVDPNWSYRTHNVAVPKFDNLGSIDRTLPGKDISSGSSASSTPGFVEGPYVPPNQLP